MDEFLRALRESGEIVVSIEAPPELDGVDGTIGEALRAHDQAFRLGIAPGAPALELDAAYWGAVKLYQACQLLTMRDAPPAVARDTLSMPYPSERGPMSEYAVDLTLAYLPSLFHLAERVAPDDPVLVAIRELASAWPLSSTGIDGIACPAKLWFWENRSLRSLYVDRIIAARDVMRLEDPLVADAVRSSLGAYPEMAPKMMEFLNAS